ncbi:MAG TPA: CPBP family intramembrane glutamic endopeptidase [Symbiobacteriaceae bacterium]|nr:CPBP family intramembrane glutamic endopeptidase [Symbiobacteriaceae bacterium]
MTLLASLLVLACGRLAARKAVRLSSKWAWTLPTLVYWASMLLLVILLAPAGAWANWFAAPQSGWGWAALALGIGVAHLSFLFLNLKALRSGEGIAAWLLFAVANGFMEELFWRGLVLQGLSSWAPWVAVLVASALFALNHPITFGPVSSSLRHPVTLVAALCMGVAWSWVALRTGSLWWPVLGHVLTNLGAMAGPVFLGLVVPPIGQNQKASA